MTPWVMTQRWNDLLFLHYAIAPEKLRPLVPEVVDSRHISASRVGFHHSVLDQPPSAAGDSVIAVGLAICRDQCRTYVTFGGKPGVYFFSLDASHLSAVWGARIFYRLPYWHAAMKVKGRGSPEIEYRSKRTHGPRPAELRGSYRPVGNSWPRLSRHHRALPDRTLLSLFGQRQAACIAPTFIICRGRCRLRSRALEQNNMALTAGIDLPAKPDLAVLFALHQGPGLGARAAAVAVAHPPSAARTVRHHRSCTAGVASR